MEVDSLADLSRDELRALTFEELCSLHARLKERDRLKALEGDGGWIEEALGIAVRRYERRQAAQWN